MRMTGTRRCSPLARSSLAAISRNSIIINAVALGAAAKPRASRHGSHHKQTSILYAHQHQRRVAQHGILCLSDDDVIRSSRMIIRYLLPSTRGSNAITTRANTRGINGNGVTFTAAYLCLARRCNQHRISCIDMRCKQSALNNVGRRRAHAAHRMFI